MMNYRFTISKTLKLLFLDFEMWTRDVGVRDGFGSDVKVVGAMPVKNSHPLFKNTGVKWDAELQKLIDMTPEEAIAAVAEANKMTALKFQEAKYAVSELEKAANHLQARRENYFRTELEKMCGHQTREEAVKEAITKCDAASDAATRAICAAERAAVKSKRFVEAICKACGKRPMTDCEDQGASCSY